MILFLTLSVGLWVLGHQMRTPKRARWIMIGLLYVLVLVLMVVLPESHGLRRSLGASFAEWGALGILALVVMGYRTVLAQMKSKAEDVERAAMPAPKPGSFQADELERYARHIMLREIGGPGQKRLKSAKVLVIGAGGLGSPALMYLAAAGVGTIGVIDDDLVESTNLQRQIAHTDARIGMPKVFSAERAMKEVNPYVEVHPYHRRLSAEIARDLIGEYDLVLDGTDNFDTRYLVNDACVALGKPLISGALTQWEGQISLFDPAHGAPCYACVFPQAPAAGLAPSCAEAGVLGPLPGVVGAMMAVEAVKVIVDAGQGLAGRMLIYDALYAETRVISLERRGDCATCGAPS